MWCYCYRLRAVIDRPPIGERELVPLPELQGFKLLPGAVSIMCSVLYGEGLFHETTYIR